MNIVYTGSSMLEIDNSKVDLSRRQTIYELAGLSFREFLAFEGILSIAPVSLKDLINEHLKIALKITSQVKILPLFEKYLFEVGGKSKTFEQIKDLPNSYLAVDDIEFGHKNRIPLWLFGLLY